ncbi:hypothetical protein HPB47_006109 [Ixodes persulcatus]|uniref:Uncharacterized protein n=1 Tax=Ixodes persulcatus TaxID=34615 RepID=A0AC60PB79_IXOPE|nr:hypothetical protein HPB47_006109 [Ixodes persulcatus]
MGPRPESKGEPLCEALIGRTEARAAVAFSSSRLLVVLLGRRSSGVANGSSGGSCPERQVQKRGRRTGRRAEGTPNCTPVHAERDRTPDPARPSSAQHGNARRRARPIGDRHAPGARPRCVRRSLRSALASSATRRPSAAAASAGGGSDPPGTRAS